FFPSELFFFLLGIIAYHIYKWLEKLNFKVLHLKLIYAFVLIFTLLYAFLPIYFKSEIYFFIVFISLPFIFMLSKNWKTDRYIGELSYPIYICHILILMVVGYLDFSTESNIGFAVLAITILFSMLLNEFIAKKIERLRQRRLKT